MIRVVLVREYALRGCFYSRDITISLVLSMERTPPLMSLLRDSIDLGGCLGYSGIKLVKLVPDLALSVLF